MKKSFVNRCLRHCWTLARCLRPAKVLAKDQAKTVLVRMYRTRRIADVVTGKLYPGAEPAAALDE
ncbi:MAG: hypothetical protein LC119_08725 [Burkholderiales bacterium]|nr:hypothetical protein [Burkholderiales bacterium]